MNVLTGLSKGTLDKFTSHRGAFYQDLKAILNGLGGGDSASYH